MPKLSIDLWEDEFIEICEKILDEEPLYPYEHLWKEGLTPQQAFMKYVEENPDYAEKLEDSKPETSSNAEQEEFLAMAKKLEQKRLAQEAEEKMSKYCPECARVIGKKKVCKCGYRKPGKKRNTYKDYDGFDDFENLDDIDDSY
ncbi:MAG: hypothetical protein Kow0029_31020 [Candidatus Rifleibacteriota bacterium]